MQLPVQRAEHCNEVADKRLWAAHRVKISSRLGTPAANAAEAEAVVAPHQTKLPLLWRLAHDHLASRAPSQHAGDYITYPCAPSIGCSILSISAVGASPLSTYHLCGAGQTHLQADAALHLCTDAAA